MEYNKDNKQRNFSKENNHFNNKEKGKYNKNKYGKNNYDTQDDTQDVQRHSDLIIGRNPVTEAIRSQRPLDKILVSNGFKNTSASVLVAKAKEQGVVIKEVDTRKLDLITNNANHQGIIAFASVKEYVEVADILQVAKDKNEPPFIIILDEIEDPHNLGAIIRTAECAGAHGIIIPKRRSAGLSGITGKASAGAVEYLPVARVTNIARTIDDLKKEGIWVYGADMVGETWCKTNLTGAVALVIGNEGKGISHLVKEKCDVMVKLPMNGQINSLNASVASGVIIYEVVKQRLGL